MFLHRGKINHHIATPGTQISYSSSVIQGFSDEGERGGRAGSRHAIVNLAALEMFTWTSSVILSLGVAVSLSSTAEWCLCEWEFSTFLAPRLLFQANASSYPGTRGMVLSWASKSPYDDHHPCTYLSKPLGNVFLNHANPPLSWCVFVC